MADELTSAASAFGNVVLVAKRVGPIRSYTAKSRTVDTLQETVTAWRAENPNAVIGITSGVFDVPHPGHTSFFEDASRECTHLIVIIASDRTVREIKGDTKPYYNEVKRAADVSSRETVSAVIISDEFFHETILEAIKPDVLFKGDDYANVKIGGSDLVPLVKLIPCAEKEFYSSSAAIRRIKDDEMDRPPDWAPSPR